MDGTDLAKLMHSHLKKVADELESVEDGRLETRGLAKAMRDPWVCTISIDDPSVWRWYNTETGEWGEPCNP